MEQRPILAAPNEAAGARRPLDTLLNAVINSMREAGDHQEAERLATFSKRICSGDVLREPQVLGQKKQDRVSQEDASGSESSSSSEDVQEKVSTSSPEELEAASL